MAGAHDQRAAGRGVRLSTEIRQSGGGASPAARVVGIFLHVNTVAGVGLAATGDDQDGTHLWIRKCEPQAPGISDRGSADAAHQRNDFTLPQRVVNVGVTSVWQELPLGPTASRRYRREGEQKITGIRKRAMAAMFVLLAGGGLLLPTASFER